VPDNVGSHTRSSIAPRVSVFAVALTEDAYRGEFDARSLATALKIAAGSEEQFTQGVRWRRGANRTNILLNVRRSIEQKGATDN
jgi:hypothetical protein